MSDYRCTMRDTRYSQSRNEYLYDDVNPNNRASEINFTLSSKRYLFNLSQLLTHLQNMIIFEWGDQ